MRAAPIFAGALSDKEETVQERLLDALSTAPRTLIEPLTDATAALMEDRNVVIRSKAMEVLALVRSENLLPLFLAALSDGAKDVRRVAAMALRYYPKENAILALQELLKDSDRDVRLAAVQSLGVIKSPQSIGPLAETFESADDEMREHIGSALSAMPRDAFFEVADVLMALSHPKARAGVAHTLGMMGEVSSIRLLETFLSDPEVMVRSAAVGALGNFTGETVAKACSGLLSDPNEKVRAAAVDAVSRMQDVRCIPDLISLLEYEPDRTVSQRIVLAVAVLFEEESKVEIDRTEVIRGVRKWLAGARNVEEQGIGMIALALLRDDTYFKKILHGIQEGSLRQAMQHLLRSIPPLAASRFFAFLSLDPDLFWRDRSEQSGEYYIKLLRTSRVVRDRIRALDAIQTLGVREAIPALESTFAKDPNPNVRAAALGALNVFLEGKALVEKIRDAVRDPSDSVRLQVIPILGELRPKELEGARSLLLPLLDSNDIRIRGPASDLIARLYRNDWEELTDLLLGAEKKARILGLIETLGKIGDVAAGPLFLQFMQHADVDVRIAAANAAAEGQCLKKSEWLLSLEDPQEKVRLAAIHGLGKQFDLEILEIFSKHADDPSVTIRREVAQILGKQRVPGDERPEKLLWKLSRDENLEVKLTALLSLYRLGRAGISPSILEISQNLEREERQTILEKIKKEGIFVELKDTIRRSRHMAMRIEAIKILAALDVHSNVSEIMESLTDPSPDVRIAAIEALALVQDPSVEQKVLALLQDPVELVRSSVKRRRLRLAK